MPHHVVRAMTLSDECIQVSDKGPAMGQESMHHLLTAITTVRDLLMVAGSSRTP
jgi:hypothetical protein